MCSRVTRRLLSRDSYKDEDGSILVDKEDKSQSRDVIYTDDGETVLLKHNIDEKE